MNSVLSFFVKKQKFAFLITVMVLLLGVTASMQIKRDMFPEIEFGVVTIETPFQGASSETVEIQVTNKIEDAIKGIGGIERIRSQSIEGFSRVVIVLDVNNKNNDEIETKIKDAVGRINDFPTTLEDRPIIYTKGSSSYPVLEIAISGNLPYKIVREHAKRLESQIKEIDGVSMCQKLGYRDHTVYIKLDSEKLKQYQLSPSYVTQALKDKVQRQNIGKLISYKNETQLFSELEFDSLTELSNSVIQTSYTGRPVLLKDIATLEKTFKDADVIARLNGKPGINFLIYRSSSSDIIKVADNIKNTLNEFKKSNPKLDIEYANDFSFYVKNRLNIVINNGLIGLILVLIVLSLFLGFKIAFWVALGIPVSILGTIFIMNTLDKPLDILSMAGFIIVIGIIVDDAIVVAENIASKREQGLAPLQAATQGITEVINPVITTVLTTIIAFFPLMMMPGIVGQFVMVIPLAIIISLIFSLTEASIALPAHLVSGLKKYKHKDDSKFKLFDKVKLLFSHLLSVLIKFRYLSILFFICLFVFSVFFAFKNIDYILFPNDSAEEIKINIETPVGSSLEYTSESIKVSEKIIEDSILNHIKAYKSLIGLNWDSENEVYSNAPHKALISIYLQPFQKREKNVDEIKEMIENQLRNISLYKKLDINIEAGGPPVGKPISIEVISQNDEVREDVAKKIVEDLSQNNAVFDINRNDEVDKKEMKLFIDDNKLQRFKLNLFEIITNIRIAFKGVDIAETTENRETTTYTVILNDAQRKSTKVLSSILVKNQQGNTIPVSNVATFKKSKGSNNYYHYNTNRSVTIEANVNTTITTINKITKELKNKYAQFDSNDVIIKFGGESAEIQKSFDSLKYSFIVAVIGIFLLLVVLFNSFWQPFLVMSAIPFAIIGIITAFGIHGQPFTFLALLGAVGLTGIVVNDSLILVYHINELADVYPNYTFKQRILFGAINRLRPIILTTLTTVLGVMPLAYGIGGYDPFIAPMGLSLGFGLMFATPLILTVIPCLMMIKQDIKNLFKK